MVRILLGEVLSAASARNAALVTAYKHEARNILSRSVSSLALSMIDQRKDLAKGLAAFAEAPGVRDTYAELDFEPGLLDAPAPWPAGDACATLKGMRKAESDDYEILASLAGAFVPLSTDIAERLASYAEQSRKRASWAQDHLDLISVCPD